MSSMYQSLCTCSLKFSPFQCWTFITIDCISILYPFSNLSFSNGVSSPSSSIPCKKNMRCLISLIVKSGASTFTSSCTSFIVIDGNICIFIFLEFGSSISTTGGQTSSITSCLTVKPSSSSGMSSSTPFHSLLSNLNPPIGNPIFSAILSFISRTDSSGSTNTLNVLPERSFISISLGSFLSVEDNTFSGVCVLTLASERVSSSSIS
mmetsp:Transcript_33075/g.78161  ORF Transcript_33075/g.78161 Transcript_33075/m.78161 type:complete len:207 (-) Transcript_33075:1240-1860(-)